MKRVASKSPPLLGIGIYSVSDASRLTGVSARRIRYWLKGEVRRVGTAETVAPPVWRRHLPLIGGQLALSFRDMLEVLVIGALRVHKVPWSEIRLASQILQHDFQDSHPFSNGAFKVFGRRILRDYETEAGSKILVHVTSKQQVFRDIVRPFLRDVEFTNNTPIHWYPNSKIRTVLCDPERQFGQPIVAREGVPTAVLANAYAVEESYERVSRWFEVEQKAVRDAVRFEKQLRQAA